MTIFAVGISLFQMCKKESIAAIKHPFYGCNIFFMLKDFPNR